MEDCMSSLNLLPVGIIVAIALVIFAFVVFRARAKSKGRVKPTLIEDLEIQRPPHDYYDT